MTEEALLKAILCDPEDDAPRLIYADWLDGEGHSDRAEFIRVQCERASLTHPTCVQVEGPPCWRCEYCLWWLETGRREGELMPDYPFPTNFVQEYRRGFIHSVECTAEDWLAHGDAILLSQPVREVTLSTLPFIAWDQPRDGGQHHWLVDGDGNEKSPRVWVLTTQNPYLLCLAARWPQIKPECWRLPPLPYAELNFIISNPRRHFVITQGP